MTLGAKSGLLLWMSIGALVSALLSPAPAASTPPPGPPLAAAAAAPSSSAVPPGAPPAGPRRLADRDPENDFVVAPPDTIADCEVALRAAGVEFEPATLPVRTGRGGVPVCGTTQAVSYRRGPERIRYGSSLLLSCGMALALASFETVLNAEARLRFGEPVVRIAHLGTYNCRKMARYPDWVSEHSYANAIDIESFTLRSGKKISILQGFGRLDREPRRNEELFLDRLSRRLYDEGVFSGVITPAFDALHRNHFHLDLARYRVNGTRGE